METQPTFGVGRGFSKFFSRLIGHFAGWFPHLTNPFSGSGWVLGPLPPESAGRQPALGSLWVGQAQQQRHPFRVLGQTPIAHLGITEASLHIQGRVFHLGTNGGLEPFLQGCSPPGRSRGPRPSLWSQRRPSSGQQKPCGRCAQPSNPASFRDLRRIRSLRL